MRVRRLDVRLPIQVEEMLRQSEQPNTMRARRRCNLLLLLAAARGWVPPLRGGPGSALGAARRRAPALDLRPLPPLAPSVEREFVTEDSDLSMTDRSVGIVTTASLPWRTGTSVNPLCRALHLSNRSNVTLYVPWLDRDGELPPSMHFASHLEHWHMMRMNFAASLLNRVLFRDHC